MGTSAMVENGLFRSRTVSSGLSGRLALRDPTILLSTVKNAFGRQSSREPKRKLELLRNCTKYETKLCASSSS